MIILWLLIKLPPYDFNDLQNTGELINRPVPGRYCTDCTKLQVQDSIHLGPICHHGTQQQLWILALFDSGVVDESVDYN